MIPKNRKNRLKVVYDFRVSLVSLEEDIDFYASTCS